MIGSVSSPSRAPPISRDALQSLEGLPARFLLMVSTSSDRCVQPKPCNSSAYGVLSDKGFNHWNWKLTTEDSPGGRLASANFVVLTLPSCSLKWQWVLPICPRNQSIHYGMVFVIWWWRIQNDSCNMTQQSKTKKKRILHTCQSRPSDLTELND